MSTRLFMQFKSQRGFAIMQAMVLVIMVTMIIASIGNYMNNSVRDKQRSNDVVHLDTLAQTVSAYLADEVLCGQSLVFAGGALNIAQAATANGQRAQVRMTLPNWLENRANGVAGYTAAFVNAPQLIPNYGNDAAPENFGPGRLRINEIILANLAVKSTFGTLTEYEANLLVQAMPVDGQNNDIDSRALSRQNVSRLVIAYRTDTNTIERCHSDLSPEFYCTEMGGTFNENAPPGEPMCNFLFDEFNCPPQQYIKDFDGTTPSLATSCQAFNMNACGTLSYATGFGPDPLNAGNFTMYCKTFGCPAGYQWVGQYCQQLGASCTIAGSSTGGTGPATSESGCNCNNSTDTWNGSACVPLAPLPAICHLREVRVTIPAVDTFTQSFAASDTTCSGYTLQAGESFLGPCTRVDSASPASLQAECTGGGPTGSWNSIGSQNAGQDPGPCGCTIPSGETQCQTWRLSNGNEFDYKPDCTAALNGVTADAYLCSYSGSGTNAWLEQEFECQYP